MGRTSDARRRLIEAAHELIWENSYGAVTIDAICERAAVKKGSFYYFFDSKADLTLETINDWWTERLVIINEIFQPEVPPLERLRRYFDLVSKSQCAEYDENGRILGCPLFTLGSEISTQDERIRLRIHEILLIGTGYFEQAIAEAQESGDVDGHDAALKANKLMSYYEGYLTKARIQNNVEAVRHLSSEVLEVIGVHSAAAAH
jgi:TetR/AcrR family transcriptional repressor of nem operon